MIWIIAALTFAQVVQGIDLEMGRAASLDFGTLGEGPWVSSDSAAWKDPTPEVSVNSARHILGRRELLQCSGAWAQCGGKSFKGQECCPDGFTCKYYNQWYSQCRTGAKIQPAKLVEQADSTEVKNNDVILKQSEPPKLGGGDFVGQATYYSDNTIGACSQKKKPSGFRAVALNSQQWAGGALCGTCIQGSYMDNGSPLSFKAIIDNLCPECKHGDLDFRKDGIGSSDGRWALEWSIIDCPSSGLEVTRENGNAHYSKVKVEGGPSPVASMTCEGLQGKRTEDAFFEFQHGGAFCGGNVACKVSFTRGGSNDLVMSQQQLGGFC